MILQAYEGEKISFNVSWEGCFAKEEGRSEASNLVSTQGW